MGMVPGERSTLKEIKEDAWYQGPLPSEEDVTRQMEERCKEVYRKLEKGEMIGLIEAVKKEELIHRQFVEDVERERRQREVEGERERSTPLTPVSETHPLDTFPSHSPSSTSSRYSAQLPRHGGFSYHSTQSPSPMFQPTRKNSDDRLTVSLLSLSDDSPIPPIQPRPTHLTSFVSGRLDPSSSSPTSTRLLSASSASASSSSSASPSPPPSSILSPAYPWAYR